MVQRMFDDIFEKNRTMLGRAQTDGLVDNLKSNLASWNVIASPGPFLPFRLENEKKELRYMFGLMRQDHGIKELT